MKKILIIGIGVGDPEYLTVQAVNALNRVDVFFIFDKGADKRSLIELREQICWRYIKDRAYRFVDAASPGWDRGAADYIATVAELNRDKQALFERLIRDGMADDECGAFLVWGDPTLYDSTIRIVDAIARAGTDSVDFEVIPGISAPQALAAKHKTTLNRVGGAVAITTGRRISERLPDDADGVVVMLDGRNAYNRYVDQELDIFWGAYIGTPKEILISGKLKEVAAEIERVRADAKGTNGWVMDTYLLRRSNSDDC